MIYTSDGSIDVVALKTHLDSGEKILLIDIRTQNERNRMSVGGMHIPSAMLTNYVKMLKDKYSEHTIVLACLQNMTRAKSARKMLAKNGVQSLMLQGGIGKWAATYKTVKIPTA